MSLALQDFVYPEDQELFVQKGWLETAMNGGKRCVYKHMFTSQYVINMFYAAVSAADVI
jgi:hypothetical protein